MTSLLKIGSTSPEVRNVQTMLNRLINAIPRLQVDGIFGPKTQARVVQFQRSFGLLADGVVGPMTAKALVGATLTATLGRR